MKDKKGDSKNQISEDFDLGDPSFFSAAKILSSDTLQDST